MIVGGGGCVCLDTTLQRPLPGTQFTVLQDLPDVPSRGLPNPSLVSEGAPGSGLRSVPQGLPGVPSPYRTPSSLIPGISRFAPGTIKTGQDCGTDVVSASSDSNLYRKLM